MSLTDKLLKLNIDFEKIGYWSQSHMLSQGGDPGHRSENGAPVSFRSSGNLKLASRYL